MNRTEMIAVLQQVEEVRLKPCEITDEELALFNRMASVLVESDHIGSLDDEIACGARHARLLVDHLLRMGAAGGSWCVGDMVVKVVAP